MGWLSDLFKKKEKKGLPDFEHTPPAPEPEGALIGYGVKEMNTSGNSNIGVETKEESGEKAHGDLDNTKSNEHIGNIGLDSRAGKSIDMTNRAKKQNLSKYNHGTYRDKKGIFRSKKG